MNRVLFLLLVTLSGCARTEPGSDGETHAHGEDAHSHGWTAVGWGDRFEVFAEGEGLRARHAVPVFLHVTALDGFRPVPEGKVTLALRGEGDIRMRYAQEAPRGEGLFEIDVTPAVPGEFDLVFLVEAAGLSEEISAGRIQVGIDHEGSVVPDARFTDLNGEPVAFGKEQQWRIPFATGWTERGVVHRTVAGPGTVRPRSGGEVMVTAPVDGIVSGDSWPYPGMSLASGAPVFRILPLVTRDRSLSELEAAVGEIEAVLEPAQARLERLEGLLLSNAISAREVEAVRGEVMSLEARRVAARRDLASARAARRGGGPGGERISLRSPFAGLVSRVLVTQGEVVEAGQPLGRIVQPDPVWIEVALRPRDAVSLGNEPKRLHVSSGGDDEGITFTGEELRIVSRSPEVDSATGTVPVIFQVEGSGGLLILGTVVDVEIGLGEAEEGIVIPESAVVDDAGRPVVYLQVDGERFVPRAIEIRGREGSRLLVAGLRPGLRLVTRGGAAIRRTSLVTTGAGHGHVH